MARAPRGKTVINDRFFEQLGKSAPVVALVDSKAESIAARARSTAPRDTNEYANGIVVESKEAQYRHVALVVAKDEKSLLIESKTGNLARALKAEGKNG